MPYVIVCYRYDRGPTNSYDDKEPAWSNKGFTRERSRSPERFNKAPPTGVGSGGWSFHKAMMEQRGRSSPPLQNRVEKSSGGLDGGHADGFRPSYYGVEEAEEGMIPQED